MRKLKDVLDEQAKAETDDRELQSRSDRRKIRNVEADALLALARQLAELPPRQFRKIELPEVVLEPVLTARKITSPGALNRQLKLVRRALKSIDWEALAVEVQEILAPSRGSGGGVLGPGAGWALRLIAEEEAAFAEFLQLCPTVTPGVLSQAVSAARRAPAGSKKATAKLARLIDDELNKSAQDAYDVQEAAGSEVESAEPPAS